MIRIYVAGPYSSDSAIGVLNNMREGMRMATKILLAGYAPFCPWLDYHFQLMLQENEKLTVDDYQKYSLAWLEACDIVFLLPGWETSMGTLKEIKRAKELGIPIVKSIKEIKPELLY